MFIRHSVLLLSGETGVALFVPRHTPTGVVSVGETAA